MKTRLRESKGVEKERGEIDNDFEGEKEKEKIVIIELWERRVYICWRVKDRERERVDFSGTGLWGTQLFLKNCFIVLYLIVVIKNSNTQTQTMGSTFKEVGVGGSKQLPLLHVKIKGPVS